MMHNWEIKPYVIRRQANKRDFPEHVLQFPILLLLLMLSIIRENTLTNVISRVLNVWM